MFSKEDRQNAKISFENGYGGVTEWLMVPLSKSGVSSWDRGFESHPFRGKGRGAGVDDQARLESACPLLGTVGSNPTLSVFCLFDE